MSNYLCKDICPLNQNNNIKIDSNFDITTRTRIFTQLSTRQKAPPWIKVSLPILDFWDETYLHIPPDMKACSGVINIYQLANTENSFIFTAANDIQCEFLARKVHFTYGNSP
jgi:hypothetical protein